MLETLNWLALCVPLIAAWGAYTVLQEKSAPKAMALIAAFSVLGVVLLGYTLAYRSIGFPFWVRWLAPSARAEPLPGRPEIDINTKLNADWTIVGMNFGWMLLVAKVHVPMGPAPEIYMRWEYAKPRTEEGKSYLSEVQMVELDCRATRMNLLVIISYAENNLSGREVYSGRGHRSQPNWDTPAPTSIGAEAIRKSCELLGK